MDIPKVVNVEAESEHLIKDRTVYPQKNFTECYKLSVRVNAPLEKGQYIVDYDPEAGLQYVFFANPKVFDIPKLDERVNMKPGYESIE